MLTDSARKIATQQELIHRLAWNAAFGCHTRNGFELVVWPEIAARARWLIFLDINGMHELNEPFDCYDPVDAMIRKVWSTIRASDYPAGQWKSGDEFLVCICASDNRPEPDLVEAEGMAQRLVEEFGKQGITIMYSIVAVRGSDLKENVLPAESEVKRMKRERGSIRRAA